MLRKVAFRLICGEDDVEPKGEQRATGFLMKAMDLSAGGEDEFHDFKNPKVVVATYES